MAKDKKAVVADAYSFTDAWCGTTGLTGKEKIQGFVLKQKPAWAKKLGDVWITKTAWPKPESKLATPKPNPVVRYRPSEYGMGEGAYKPTYIKGEEVANGVFALKLVGGLPDELRERLAP